MQTVFSAVLYDVPQAAVIWLALIAVAAVVIGALIVRPDLFRSVFGERISEAARPSSLELAAEDRERSRERARFAQEVEVAAARAAATAERRRAEWLAAQDEVETAWQAYEAAEEDVRRLAAAAALPLPRTARTPAEYADRERWLHRAATAAQERGEITVEQLSDILQHRGWDPRRHPVEQELLLRRLIRDNVRARHQSAQEREQAAWRVAELAAAAARSLRQEVYAATRPDLERPSSLAIVDLTGPETTRELPAPARAESGPAARGRSAVPAF